MPSNGIAKEKIVSVLEKISEIKHPRMIISFSLDGPKEIHNKIRGLKCYEKVLESYEKVREITKKDKKIEVFLESTISSYNIEHLEEFLKEKLKKNKITITIAHDAYLYNNIGNNQIKVDVKNLNKIKRIVDLIEKKKKRLSPEVIEKIYVKNIIKFVKNPKKMFFPCKAFRSCFSINQFGDVIPCLMWGYNLGNLRNYEYDIKRIWNSVEAKKVRKIISRGKCPNCWTPCEAYPSIASGVLSNPLRIFI
jgi:sulfatase maturation enzyme AslB (radical SAM superfamily)